MNDERYFLDTNILVYAYDSSAGNKYEIARKIVMNLWDSGYGSISTQVLQEFIVTVTRKISHPISLSDVRRIAADLLCWEVVVNDGESCVEALDLVSRNKISYWNALIITAAQRSNATTLLSEDLSHNNRYQSILVQNPFATS